MDWSSATNDLILKPISIKCGTPIPGNQFLCKRFFSIVISKMAISYPESISLFILKVLQCYELTRRPLAFNAGLILGRCIGNVY